MCKVFPCEHTHTYTHMHWEGGRAASAKRKGQLAAHQNPGGKPRKHTFRMIFKIIIIFCQFAV